MQRCIYPGLLSRYYTHVCRFTVCVLFPFLHVYNLIWHRVSLWSAGGLYLLLGSYMKSRPYIFYIILILIPCFNSTSHLLYASTPFPQGTTNQVIQCKKTSGEHTAAFPMQNNSSQELAVYVVSPLNTLSLWNPYTHMGNITKAHHTSKCVNSQRRCDSVTR